MLRKTSRTGHFAPSCLSGLLCEKIKMDGKVSIFTAKMTRDVSHPLSRLRLFVGLPLIIKVIFVCFKYSQQFCWVFLGGWEGEEPIANAKHS